MSDPRANRAAVVLCLHAFAAAALIVLLMAVVSRILLNCVLTVGGFFMGCLLPFLTAFVAPGLGFGESIIETMLTIAEVYFAWECGDLDDFGLFLMLFAIGCGFMLSFALGYMMSKKGLPNVVIGMASIIISGAIGPTVNYVKDEYMKAKSLGATPG